MLREQLEGHLVEGCLQDATDGGLDPPLGVVAALDNRGGLLTPRLGTVHQRIGCLVSPLCITMGSRSQLQRTTATVVIVRIAT